MTFLAFKICKYKMHYGLQNKVEQETILVSYVKNNLENWNTKRNAIISIITFIGEMYN